MPGKDSNREKNEFERLKTLAGPLLSWYARSARSLPWRENPEPYRVWISEIMLQQTRVEAVLPYFERFMREFPDPGALAAAAEDRLLKVWEGLGYYSRARNLQKAAKTICDTFGGLMPLTRDELLRLPGVGPYTAGAIASIAYGEPVPAVDGNVLRVLSRLLASSLEITKPQNRAYFEQAAQAMQPSDRAGDFNQAMMELGATVCLPSGEPLCHACPVAAGCAAKREGNVRAYPVRAAKKPRRQETRTVLVLLSNGRVLLHRRVATGLLPGLWELPNEEGELTPSEAAEAAGRLGAVPSEPVPLGGAKHIFSHIEWKMTGYRLDTGGFPPPEGFVWADARELRGRYALPSAFRAYSGLLPAMLKDKGQFMEDENGDHHSRRAQR